MEKTLHCKMCHLRIIVYFCLLSIGHRSLQIHRKMTNEEFQSVFHTDRNSVPEYQIVPVMHSLPDYKKNGRLKIFFQAFGKNVNLNLDPADNVLFAKSTPIYTVESNSSYINELKYNLLSGIELNNRSRIYEDPKRMASIVSYKGQDGKIHFSGICGGNYVIRSLPKRILKIVNEDSNNAGMNIFFQKWKNNSNSSKLTNRHVIFKISTKKQKNKRHIVANESFIQNSISAINKKKLYDNRTTKNLPKIVYPEILIIVDYNGFKSHSMNIMEALIYYAAFFNAVDLKYRTLKNPKVRLNIAAIIIALDNDATPYLERKRIENDLIEAGALDELSLYLYKEKRFPRHSYDTVVAITKSQLCEFPKNSKNPSNCPRVRGISKYGSACNWDEKTKRVEAVALIHDTGFNGIATAAHELAHIFGVPHDGSPSLSYVGGPGAKKCRWADGYLMSSFRHDQHALKWSNCSQQCFTYFFHKPEAKCLYNKPARMVGTVPKILPGKLLNVDEQCYEAIGGESCWHSENVCTLLWCRIPNTETDCVASTPAAEGSECGIGKICKGGLCVKK